MLARVGLGLALVAGLSIYSCNEPRRRASPQTPVSQLAPPADREVVLASDGHARIVVVAPERTVAPETSPPAPVPGQKVKKPRKPRLTKEQRRMAAAERQLGHAVDDLAAYLARLAGAEVKVVRKVSEVPADSVPILVGELAEERFGPVNAHTVGGQSFRFVVKPTAIGLYGESDLATGYAIYELLDRLGCRWFMPGELGEDIPRPARLSTFETDETLAPSTIYRGLWYVDDDFKRRNRLGGVRIAAGHMLEKWVTQEQREQHPEWRAEIRGKPDPKRLRWSNPEVAKAIALAIDQSLARRPAESISISPLDGSDFDQSLDRAIDAADFDPTTNQVSLTDRLLVLANRVAEHVTPQHPDLLLGLLAYVSYTRPPVREKVHPNVVPVLAPITYCRPRPLADDACPGAKDLREIIQGWAARSQRLAFRGYLFNLAEPSAPNPMIRKASSDLPFLFANRVEFFQPETLPSFEASLPALYLSMRLAWNDKLEPRQVLAELFDRFYGKASQPARAYLDTMDRAWTEAPVFAGAGLGHARRFNPELMTKARRELDAARGAAASEVERRRLAMLDESLSQLERYLKLARDFREGRLAGLERGVAAWLSLASELGDRYASNSAFGKTGWAKKSAYGAYVQRFLQPLYAEATRIQREQALLHPRPLCTAHVRFTPELSLPLGTLPPSLSHDDTSTDYCLDTWSTLGRHDYFGTALYETTLESAAMPPGKRAYLWLSKVDGVAQVWINGRPVLAKDAKAAEPPTAEAHLKSLTFDVTEAWQGGGPNRMLIAVQRTRLAELGAGGLLGPVLLYRDR